MISLSAKKVKIVKKENNISTLKEVYASDVKISEIIRVFSGDIIALDGVVVSGQSVVDQSTLTGESFPVDKKVDDLVYSGTLNLSGSIDVLVTKEAKDSSIQKLITIVQKAQKEKAPTQRLIDKFASLLVPLALLIAILTFLITLFLGFEMSDSINRAVTVLVVFALVHYFFQLQLQ